MYWDMHLAKIVSCENYITLDYQLVHHHVVFTRTWKSTKYSHDNSAGVFKQDTW